VLKRIKDPGPLRDVWKDGSRCQYGSVRGITKKKVKLANIGRFIRGADIPREILDFMEVEIRKTYPTLEITLICMLTVGLLPSLFVVGIVLTALAKLALCLGHRLATATERRSGDADVHGRDRRADDLQQQTYGSPQEAHVLESQAYELQQIPSSRPPSYKSTAPQWRIENV
jgi:hypothetical protein